MFECAQVFKPDMVPDYIKIQDLSPKNATEAQQAATRKAQGRLKQPMLLAWLNGQTGRHFPDVDCCQSDKPTWVMYAENRGGVLAVEIGRGDYIFIFREGADD